MAGYILDTSAIMAVIYDEEGAQEVTDVMRGQDPILVPFLVLMEVHYKLLRERPDDVDDGLSMVHGWPVRMVESDPVWRDIAAQLKARGRLSVVDAWAAALALMEDAQLVHKDPQFEGVPNLKMLALPYKPRGARS